MRKYRRMTYEDRCHISALLQAEYSIYEISIVLGFHKSTLYRELRRNSVGNLYTADRATIEAAKKYRRCRRKKIITHELHEKLLQYLKFGWSPEHISGRLKLEKSISVSYQTIYRKYSRQSLGSRYLRRCNRRGGGRVAQQRSRVNNNKVMVSMRPTIADQRRRIGDWERDGMHGANFQQLLVFTDRKSRFTKLEKMKTGKMKDVTNITIKVLSDLGKKVYTVTNDNGSEFNDSASLPYPAFHCTPYKPQQRGTVENKIGLIRQT